MSFGTNDDIELESPKPNDDGASQQELSMPGDVNSLQQLVNIPDEYLNINQVCSVVCMIYCEICAYLVHILCTSCEISYVPPSP